MQLINSLTPLDEARGILAKNFDLKFTKAVERVTARIYERIKDRIPEIEWPFYAPLILQINRMKKQKDALILAHRYQSPQIYHGVADVTGDTLQLALAARAARQSVIVQASVQFMAETTKLLAPKKTVLLPDGRAGCSVAASITPEDVIALRGQYPGVPVIAYVTSSAAVKALSDITCTTANAVEIADALPGDRVIMLPDQYLARNTAKKSKKKIIAWAGACEVHESFTAQDIAELRNAYPDAKILTHPEAPPEVTAAADFSGDLDAMVTYLGQAKSKRAVLVTECSMSDNIASEFPDTEFTRGCNLCPHMKRITLENILWALHT
ncbi:MAG: quinolinate synthase NadA, partial [Alphaproteobacteria bacterium]